ncbi:MAG TPA: hypothetical protein PLH91_00710 [Tenuifilaceae bacterium]|nr:hypothetical protein [Tenuifilaceae bacterium]HOZ13424.1 hypothetical protein [Tenuifilaceae bacterium]HPI43725.1 hypothetical protein [Tenuifilaceae bacterium]HPN21027.1 hypothetical protein [Tenuifilaceae bacterium]HPV55711.1 hypothetical protein [Tenuifilaceae bacterium]
MAKITKIEDSDSSTTSTKTFIATDESKAKAKNLRIIAIVSWIIAIGFEVGAILLLRKVPINMTWLIVLIVADLIFAVVGSILWKKSNRLDPASEKDKIKFFVQNQLGLIIAIIAFLPLVILIFTNKNMSGKQKGILGSIAVVALVIAGITGTDFNPPSQEEYAEQTEEVKSLNNGNNHVYWTKSGKSYHLYQDCSYINTNRTNEIFEGTVANARELKNITDLCDRCANRAKKGTDIPTTTE